MKIIITIFFFCVFTGNNIFGQFTDVTGIFPFNQNNLIAQIIDYDNDGDDDVIGCIIQNPESSKLYRNNGDGSYTDVSTTVNSPAGNLRVILDFNKDGNDDIVIYRYNGATWSGYLDFYVNKNGVFYSADCGSIRADSLFQVNLSNLRRGKFEDVNNDGIYDLVYSIFEGTSIKLFVKYGKLTCDLCGYGFKDNAPEEIFDGGQNQDLDFQLIDFDNDDDFDLITAVGYNQYTIYNYKVLLNDGLGHFSSVPDNLGITQGRINAFGLPGDFNNDGLIDIVSGAADCCFNNDSLSVFFSNGAGNYIKSSSAMIKTTDAYYGGASVIDFDMDGWQDVFWNQISAIGTSALKFYKNNANSTFTEMASIWGISHGLTYGCCPIPGTTNGLITDINNDFKPDIDIQSVDFQPPYNFFQNWTFINQLPGSSLKLRLIACQGLTEGYGARINYKTGGQWHTVFRYSHSESYYQPFTYLGCGNSTAIDSLIIDWVGGGRTIKTNILSGQFLVVKEESNCIYQNQGLIAPITGPTDVNVGETISLFDNTPNGNWTSSDNTIATINSNGVIYAQSSGNVTIYYTLLTACGTLIAEYNINVRSDCNPYKTIKNAFSPNGDGINDSWEAFGADNCIKKVSVFIYNRYGSLVYRSLDYQNNWKGDFNGKPCPDGTYYAIINFELISGAAVTKRRDITILR